MRQVMIVDDNGSVRSTLSRLVEAEGAPPLEAASSEHALRILEGGTTVAVALIDIALPGRNGLWLAKELQQTRPEIAVVVVSGDDEPRNAILSLEVGAIDYLVKPFTRGQFRTAFHRAVAAHETRGVDAPLKPADAGLDPDLLAGSPLPRALPPRWADGGWASALTPDAGLAAFREAELQLR